MKNRRYFLFFLLFSCNHGNNREVIVERYANGQQKIVNTFSNPSDTSTYQSRVYFDNGNLAQNVEFRNDSFVNRRVTYFLNQNIFELDSFYTPQKRGDKSWTGKVSMYYPNGKIAHIYFVKNGKMVDIIKNYDTLGILYEEFGLVDTVKNGVYITYYKNGKKSYQTNYTMGKKSGMEYRFKNNGDTLDYGLYQDEKNKFPYKLWLKNGYTLVGNYLNENEIEVMWTWYDSAGIKIKSKVEHSVKGHFVVPY
jgi:antitoxin component YwqK of YwqJK toxin-antitoxin module